MIMASLSKTRKEERSRERNEGRKERRKKKTRKIRTNPLNAVKAMAPSTMSVSRRSLGRDKSLFFCSSAIYRNIQTPLNTHAPYTLYTIHYMLYSIHYKLYTTHYTLYTIYYTVYTIYTIH